MLRACCPALTEGVLHAPIHRRACQHCCPPSLPTKNLCGSDPKNRKPRMGSLQTTFLMTVYVSRLRSTVVYATNSEGCERLQCPPAHLKCGSDVRVSRGFAKKKKKQYDERMLLFFFLECTCTTGNGNMNAAYAPRYSRHSVLVLHRSAFLPQFLGG